MDSRPGNSAGGRPTLTADICDAGAMEELMGRERPDAVFNLAAVLGRDKTEAALRSCMEVNLRGALTVLRAATAAGAQRVILMGSAEELGDRPGPQTEDMEPRPLSPYGISKAAMTWMALATHRESGAPVVVMRPSTVYGPGQPAALFVAQAVGAAVGEGRFEMSEGRQRRDMVFVTDVARGLVAAAATPQADGEIINLSSADPRPLREVASRIWELTDSRAELAIGALEASRAQLADTWGDNSKARRLLGWSPVVDLDSGLEATIAAARSRGPDPSG